MVPRVDAVFQDSVHHLEKTGFSTAILGQLEVKNLHQLLRLVVLDEGGARAAAGDYEAMA